MRLPISIQAILFRRHKGSIEYLLLKRLKSRGGFWQPISGGLEDGEKLEECVRREVKEEAGISKIKKIISKVYFYQWPSEMIIQKKSRNVLISEYVSGVEVSITTRVNLHKNVYPEHSKFKWCKYDEAKKLLKWSSNKLALTKLHGRLKRT